MPMYVYIYVDSVFEHFMTCWQWNDFFQL